LPIYGRRASKAGQDSRRDAARRNGSPLAKGKVRNDSDMTIRPVTDLRELGDCVQIQREAWGLAELEVIPVRMLVTQNRVGGLVLGAFEDGQLVGFLNAMPGIRDGTPYWYSQMLAVKLPYRNRGIGSNLKLAQRDHARQRGIHLIEWTFDPLESKNAYLNIAKLGVIARRYYVNLYCTTAYEL